MGTAYKVYYLKGKYKKDYITVFKELDAEGFEEYLKRERGEELKEEKEQKEFEKRKKKEIKQKREEWRELGGVA